MFWGFLWRALSGYGRASHLSETDSEEKGLGQVTPRVGHGTNCITDLSLLASDSQKPRTHARPVPEGLPQFPNLILPQDRHLPRAPAVPGIQQMEVRSRGLEMALGGVGCIPWYWGTQFPLSANSHDEPFQGLEAEADRQFPEAIEHPTHSPRILGCTYTP